MGLVFYDYFSMIDVSFMHLKFYLGHHSQKVQFIKWKLYLSLWYIIAWRHEVHFSRAYIILLYAFFFVLLL